MTRRKLNTVIVLAVVALSAVVVTQFYWVQRAYRIQDRTFNATVVSSMTAVVDRILEMNNDSALVEPVEQVSSSFFVANINDTLHPYLLEALLREEFERNDLRKPFEYGIYDCFNDSIVFGSTVNFAVPDATVAPEPVGIQKRFDRDGHYFGIAFPSKTTMILGQLGFWGLSTLLTLVVVIFFSYTIAILLRQKRLSEVKTDFINNMTHELKTPISTIRLSSEILQSAEIGNQPDRLRQYARIIHQENERLQLQVDKVLQIATLSPEKMKLKEEAVDFHTLIQAVAESAQVRLDPVGGMLEIELEALRATVVGDLVHLSNILNNLLDNAIKYTERTPLIRISTRQSRDSKLQIAVQDNGIGIDRKHQKMVFEQFFRVPTGNRHDVKGFGLGLYYVKTVVDAHNGTIDLSSEPGQGSTFTITLPVSP